MGSLVEDYRDFMNLSDEHIARKNVDVGVREGR